MKDPAEASKPITEKLRITCVRLGIPVTETDDYDSAKKRVNEALGLTPTPWELALAREIGQDTKGKNRGEVFELLYSDGHGKHKRSGQVAKLHKAMARLSETEAFHPYFAALVPQLVPGVEVVTWYRSESYVFKGTNGNGYCRLRGRSGSIHYSAIQAVYRVLAD
jgi:hypothetical protein